MKYITITVKAEVKDELYDKVSDEIWEKYQNGEITAIALYSHYFNEISSDNLNYEITELEEIEEG